MQWTLAAWVDLVNRHPSNEQFHQDLAQACLQLNDIEYSADVWRQLVENHPISVSLVTKYVKAIIELGEKEKNQEKTVNELVILFTSRPRHARGEIIWQSLKSTGVRGTWYSITTWKRMVMMYPDDLYYIKGLEDELETRDTDTQIKMWMHLLEIFPYNTAL